MKAAYDRALALPVPFNGENPKKAALDRAHELRKFEIENYWKRATYFWSFQAIAFVVLGFILQDGKLEEPIQILQLPAAIGAVSGFIAWLSARGSKYWQENWESHVDMLEAEVEGRLTQLIWSDGRLSHSVTQLNQTFIGLTTICWIAVMAVASAGSLPSWLDEWSPWWLFLLLVVVLFGISGWTKQNFTGYIVHQDSWIEHNSTWSWSWKRRGNGKEQRALLVRHTKAKDATAPDE